LVYQPIAYDRSLLSPQQVALEQELDDSGPTCSGRAERMVVLAFPIRTGGHAPINLRTQALPTLGVAPAAGGLIDDETMSRSPVGWWPRGATSGLSNWYKDNAIPVGGFLHLRPGTEPGTVLLGYDRRRAQREWVRLGAVKDNKLQFELMRRAIPCGYDDLLIVGTDVVAAVDAHAKRAVSLKLSVGALLSEVFPSLAS
jgi:hypothetical protein